jgi:hypothetical protein
MPKLIIVTGYDRRRVSDVSHRLRCKSNIPAHPSYDFKESAPDFAHPEKMVRLAQKCITISKIYTLVVATFSDYFVKEINNCIMAAHAGGAAKRIGYTPDMYLDAANVEAWIVERDGTAKQVQIDPKYGMERSAFDDEMRSIDDAANALAAGIELLE